MSRPALSLKGDFPFFRCREGLTYLDNAATTQKPRLVLDKIQEVYTQYNANIHRGLYEISVRASSEYESVRRKLLEFVNGGDEYDVVFTKGTTESINLVSVAWAEKNLKEGDEIILSEVEHHANLIPWYQLREKKGIKIKFLPVDPVEGFQLEELDRLVNGRTKLVALCHKSNLLGIELDVGSVREKIKEIPLLLDGAQMIPHKPLNLRDMDVDFYAISAHKMFGPTGVGALFVKKSREEEMDVYQTGGDMIEFVTYDSVTFADPPLKWEAGTTNYVGVIAWGAAIDYLRSLNWEEIEEYERNLTDFLLEKLKEVKGVKVLGPADARKQSGVVSFVMEPAHPHDIATVLDQYEVCVRAGHHCVQPYHRKLGMMASVRASLAFYNDEEDVERLIRGLKKVEEIFGRVKP